MLPIAGQTAVQNGLTFFEVTHWYSRGNKDSVFKISRKMPGISAGRYKSFTYDDSQH